TDRYGYTREFKVYECEDCSDCPLRSLCTKAKEGNNRKIYYNQKWEQQKSYTKQQLSEKETGEIYGKRNIEVEPAFGFLKANLSFTRMSVRGNEKVENELGFAFMAINLRKYTAMNAKSSIDSNGHPDKNGSSHQKSMTGTIFKLFLASYVPASFLTLLLPIIHMLPLLMLPVIIARGNARPSIYVTAFVKFSNDRLLRFLQVQQS